jgi:hypothetical protein
MLPCHKNNSLFVRKFSRDCFQIHPILLWLIKPFQLGAARDYSYILTEADWRSIRSISSRVRTFCWWGPGPGISWAGSWKPGPIGGMGGMAGTWECRSNLSPRQAEKVLSIIAKLGGFGNNLLRIFSRTMNYFYDMAASIILRMW